MKKMCVGLLVMLLSLSGCAWTGDYDKYADALSAHSTAEAERIDSQAEAIMEAAVNTETTTAVEQTLLSVIAMMQIERLQPVPLGIKAPTTGMDVLHAAVGYIPFMTMGLTTYKIAERGFETAGNVTLNAADMAINDSFVTTETHATGYASNATAAVAPPTVVEPAVVDPVIVQQPVAVP